MLFVRHKRMRALEASKAVEKKDSVKENTKPKASKKAKKSE